MKKLLLIALIISVCLSKDNAQIIRSAGMTEPIQVPTIFVTGSFTAFSTAQGSASAAQSITVSGALLTGNGTVTAGTGMEVSLSSGSGYGASVTITEGAGIFTGQPITIFYRIAALTLGGSYSGNLAVSSAGATTVNVPYTASVSGATKDTARFQFDTTAAFNQIGWGVLNGDPSINVKTVTNGGITISTVSTSVLNWSPFGACTGANTGVTTATVPVGATGIMREAYFNANTSFIQANPQFTMSGFDPTKTYDIKIYATFNCSFSLSTTGDYRVSGASVSSVQTFLSLCNLSTILTFPAVVPKSDGTINVYFNLASSGPVQVAGMSGVEADQN